ncbi:MAG: hypothetical protein HC859_06735 [Bacteroidia bacterium]|nr:hypothetical protein [Bacteroidia bacterium]
MKRIWQYLAGHMRANYDARLYGLTLAMLALALILNYRYDLHDRYLDRIPGMLRVAGYMVYYSAVYYVVVAIIRFTQDRDAVVLTIAFG